MALSLPDIIAQILESNFSLAVLFCKLLIQDNIKHGHVGLKMRSKLNILKSDLWLISRIPIAKFKPMVFILDTVSFYGVEL